MKNERIEELLKQVDDLYETIGALSKVLVALKIRVETENKKLEDKGDDCA